jgi:tetratricopeptide (TPR) repeat protein
MFCVNPACPEPANPGEEDECVHCGTDLLIEGRYRPMRPLKPIRSPGPTHVFEVEDEVEQSRKALKVLNVPSAERVALMYQEFQALTPRSAPGRIPLADIGGYFTLETPAGQVLRCLVMEWIEGINLADLLEISGKIPERLAIDWIQQVVEILQIVHDRNLVHQDLKPANLMLRPDGQIALVDFGSIRKLTDPYLLYLDQVLERPDDDGENITAQITVVNSGGYNPTEQLYGRSVPQSDFFALGRTVIHLLTGITPSKLPSTADGNLQWRSQAPQVSAPLADFLDRLVQPNWRDRPPDAEAILKLLESLPQQVRRDQFRRSWKFKSLAIGTGVVAATLALWGLNAQQGVLQQRATQAKMEQAQQLLGQGTQLQLQGNYSDAQDRYEQALKLRPESIDLQTDIHNNLAVLCQNQEKFPCAIENYRRALQLRPDRPQTAYNLGSLYDDLNDFTNARRYYDQVLRLNTVLKAETKNNLSRIEIIQGDYGRAIRLATEALTQNPNPITQASLYKNLGWAQFKLRQYAQSVGNLEKAQALENRADVECLLSQVKQSQGQIEGAKANGKRCLQQNDVTTRLPEVQQWRNNIINQLIQ